MQHRRKKWKKEIPLMPSFGEKDSRVTDKSRSESSILSKILDTAGSVRFGIILLNLLVLICLLGMLIRQHNVAGFDTYIAELSEFQRVLFTLLGLFDIYHSWYFNLLLALLSLNIILASVEHFPKTLRCIRNRNFEPSSAWLEGQDQYASLVVDGTRNNRLEQISKACKRMRWRKVVKTEMRDKTYLFAESGAWNRLGAYPVHVALLTILFGGLLSSLFGLSGQMPLTRGQTSDQISGTVFRDGRLSTLSRKLPFTVSCIDLEQKLIDPRGSIETKNSLDWLTHIEIRDESGTQGAIVGLNRPFDYRGYRLFHSTFLPIGKARSVLIQIKSEEGPAREISLKQNESFALPDGYSVQFVDFRANLSLERREENENSTAFQNPAAILEIISPDGARKTAFAFTEERNTDQTSFSTFDGRTLQLLDFERVSEQHILFVQYDPGTIVLYTGFLLLLLSLAAVFIFSHQRVWIVIEERSENNLRVTFGGDTNRNHLAFERKFLQLIDSVSNGIQ